MAGRLESRRTGGWAGGTVRTARTGQRTFPGECRGTCPMSFVMAPAPCLSGPGDVYPDGQISVPPEAHCAPSKVAEGLAECGHHPARTPGHDPPPESGWHHTKYRPAAYADSDGRRVLPRIFEWPLEYGVIGEPAFPGECQTCRKLVFPAAYRSSRKPTFPGEYRSSEFLAEYEECSAARSSANVSVVSLLVSASLERGPARPSIAPVEIDD